MFLALSLACTPAEPTTPSISTQTPTPTSTSTVTATLASTTIPPPTHIITYGNSTPHA